MQMPEGRWLEVDGIRTRYYEAGSGDPVVFVYGGNFGTGDAAAIAYTWNLQLAPLGERYRVIAFDKLGQGETANPKNDDYTMQATRGFHEEVFCIHSGRSLYRR